MARVIVVSDTGWKAWDELVAPADLATEHFRRYLVERLTWGVEDAAANERTSLDSQPPRPTSRRNGKRFARSSEPEPAAADERPEPATAGERPEPAQPLVGAAMWSIG